MGVGQPEFVQNPVTVLYVAGSGRSGSTILANILGQVEGFFATGELWNIWRRGLSERRKCGCGAPVAECPAWNAILRRAFDRPPQDIDAGHFDALVRKRLRLRETPGVFSLTPATPLDGDEYRTALAGLYRAVAEETGSRVIVDSSKSATYAALLASLPGVRVHVVHLVRDSRASAFSHGRARGLPDFGDHRPMRRERPFTAARRWVRSQVMTERLLPHRVSGFVTVRYEDLVRRPIPTLERILDLTGEPGPLPVVGERAVRLEPTHSVSGNPARFRTGLIELRMDDEWRTAMPAADHVLVTSLTWPLLHHYGYALTRAR